jgi:hypothetical protein
VFFSKFTAIRIARMLGPEIMGILVIQSIAPVDEEVFGR